MRFDFDDYVYEALRAGASGFLPKGRTPARLDHRRQERRRRERAPRG
jgi:hypothetical protein